MMFGSVGNGSASKGFFMEMGSEGNDCILSFMHHECNIALELNIACQYKYITLLEW